MLLEIIRRKYIIKEIYCPAKYTIHSSSINIQKSIKYGLLVLWYSLVYKLKQHYPKNVHQLYDDYKFQLHLQSNVHLITNENMESNYSINIKIPPNGVSFSDFICIFAMSCTDYRLISNRSTKLSENSDMTKSWATFCCSGY